MWPLSQGHSSRSTPLSHRHSSCSTPLSQGHSSRSTPLSHRHSSRSTPLSRCNGSSHTHSSTPISLSSSTPLPLLRSRSMAFTLYHHNSNSSTKFPLLCRRTNLSQRLASIRPGNILKRKEIPLLRLSILHGRTRGCFIHRGGDWIRIMMGGHDGTND